MTDTWTEPEVDDDYWIPEPVERDPIENEAVREWAANQAWAR